MKRSPECLVDCKSACCNHSLIRLDDNEAGNLLEAGSDMRRLDPGGVEDGRRLWALDVCGFLGGVLCLGRKTSQQPHKCQKLQPGSQGCLEARLIKPHLVRNRTQADVDWARKRL